MTLIHSPIYKWQLQNRQKVEIIQQIESPPVVFQLEQLTIINPTNEKKLQGSVLFCRQYSRNFINLEEISAEKCSQVHLVALLKQKYRSSSLSILGRMAVTDIVLSMAQVFLKAFLPKKCHQGQRWMQTTLGELMLLYWILLSVRKKIDIYGLEAICFRKAWGDSKGQYIKFK